MKPVQVKPRLFVGEAMSNRIDSFSHLFDGDFVKDESGATAVWE